MASVNKHSLREEFEALKGRFAQLCTDGKITAESRALFEALLMLLQVLMAVFMEKNTSKTSTNSSKPSSRTEKDESALSHTGTHTKGKVYDPSRSANTRTVETVEVSKVSSCEECGEDLREGLPVMVWIYGGSFLIGTTSQPAYDGTHLAEKGVVLVSLAYRTGVFGFLADPELSAESPHHVSGNYGLLDMIAGLKWVKHNIAKFGGDPSRVTIFGESAGGVAVGMLAQSPPAKGLFQRAIGESGTGLTPPRAGRSAGLAAAEAVGRSFLAKLGAKDIKSARALNAQVLQRELGPAEPTSKVAFRPVRDGYVVPRDGYPLYQEGRFNDTPILIGSNSDEGSLFVPAHTTPSQFEDQIRAAFGAQAKQILAAYPHATDSQASQAAIDMFRDTQMAWPAWTWAKLQSEKGKDKAYLYNFDAHAPQYPTAGSPHGAEIGYVFDNLGTLIHTGAALTWPPSADDPSLAALISGYWVNFAKTGNPNGPGPPYWPAFNASSQRVMYLDTHPHPGPVPNLEKLKVLDAYFTWVRQQERSPGQTQH